MTRRLSVPWPDLRPFEDRNGSPIRILAVSDAVDPALDHAINREALDKIHSYTEVGRDEGAKLLTGGEIATENGLDRGFFYRPTIFGDVDPETLGQSPHLTLEVRLQVGDISRERDAHLPQ